MPEDQRDNIPGVSVEILFTPDSAPQESVAILRTSDSQPIYDVEGQPLIVDFIDRFDEVFTENGTLSIQLGFVGLASQEDNSTMDISYAVRPINDELAGI